MEEIKMQASDGAEMRWTMGGVTFIPFLRMKQVAACNELLRDNESVTQVKLKLSCTRQRGDHSAVSYDAYMTVTAEGYTLSVYHDGEWHNRDFTQDAFETNVREAAMLRALGD